jgi:ferredoxin
MAVPTITFARSGKTAPLPPDRTVLELAEDLGVEIDFACRVGVCGLCKVKLLSGSVSMESEDGLSPEEKAQGLILACQARATESIVVDV